jgi:hypothetical protein
MEETQQKQQQKHAQSRVMGVEDADQNKLEMRSYYGGRKNNCLIRTPKTKVAMAGQEHAHRQRNGVANKAQQQREVGVNLKLYNPQRKTRPERKNNGPATGLCLTPDSSRPAAHLNATLRKVMIWTRCHADVAFMREDNCDEPGALQPQVGSPACSEPAGSR